MDDAPHGPSFEDLLASPHLQFDLDNELLPHLLTFGPPKPRRPWLFDAATSTTATGNSGPSATFGINVVVSDQVPANEAWVVSVDDRAVPVTLNGEHVGEVDGPVVVDAVRIVGIGESED